MHTTNKSFSSDLQNMTVNFSLFLKLASFLAATLHVAMLLVKCKLRRYSSALFFSKQSKYLQKNSTGEMYIAAPRAHILSQGSFSFQKVGLVSLKIEKTDREKCVANLHDFLVVSYSH